MDDASNVGSQDGSDEVSNAGSHASVPPPATSKTRMIAVAVTAVALLAIAIPFVWQPHVGAEPTTTTAAGDVTPAASHDNANRQARACMANAKPANFDFTMKDVDGNQVSLVELQGQGRAAELLGNVVRAVQGGNSRLRSFCRKSIATSSSRSSATRWTTRPRRPRLTPQNTR